MIRKLAHICIDTDNMPGMLDFYTNKLGMPLKFTLKNKDGVDFGFFIACGETTFLEIFDRDLKRKHWSGGATGNEPLPPMAKGTQLVHLCFEVTALADFRTKLEQAGVKIGTISTGMSKGRQAWTADPDGNPVELMEYTGESFHLQP
jgi:lactoylglutathione lyase/glyoxylase I family protein